MRKFLKYLFVFFLPIVLVFICTEVLIWNIPNDYQQKSRYLETHAPEIETLILGASHAFSGLNPAFFPSHTYNAAYVSQSLDIDLFILEKYKNQWNNLKSVALVVSYPSLYERLIYTDEYWRLNDYARYFDSSLATDVWYRSEVLSNKFWYNLYRIYSYYLCNNSAVLSESNGWRKRIHDPLFDFSTHGKERALLHTIDDPRCYEENVAILSQIIEFCSEHNIQLLLCTLPVYHTYLDCMNEKQANEFIETMEALTMKNEAVSYINLLNSPDFTKVDFIDSDHLAESGAKKASLIIANQ